MPKTVVNMFLKKSGLVKSVTSVVSIATIRLSHLTSRVNYISYITHYFDHGKPSSISQLINGKLRNLKFIIYFNGATTSAFNQLLSVGVLPIILS